MIDQVKLKEAIEWIEFILKNPDEYKALQNALDLLNQLKENK